MTFTLDNQAAGSYFHSPDATTDMMYNVAVYANSLLDNAEHTITMTAQPGVGGSYIAFDYAIYRIHYDGRFDDSDHTHDRACWHEFNHIHIPQHRNRIIVPEYIHTGIQHGWHLQVVLTGFTAPRKRVAYVAFIRRRPGLF
ncbi:hypothetical protein PUNSTDRAFT_136405 [Punctularia strigosozonata HHB-11173 SS5]|uniref:uncharacterized protein n=1 Tax=Punctularia strigosozonata (strain HHB-11173) TaxID=741275 RepID=UPI0004417AEB|nr:uncharacterized protein PUNSTDRAFT_136405 [Punctularia strigosozonata HHB-11173 SS5]EIN06551.1 hypothetical protein PUNSTDRAFT_136405 [Punctularia strigosozonata HHB-11173 SS5]